MQINLCLFGPFVCRMKFANWLNLFVLSGEKFLYVLLFY